MVTYISITYNSYFIYLCSQMCKIYWIQKSLYFLCHVLGYLNVCNVNNQRSSVISMDCMVSYISLLTIRSVKMASAIQISSFILNKMYICCFFFHINIISSQFEQKMHESVKYVRCVDLAIMVSQPKWNLCDIYTILVVKEMRTWYGRLMPILNYPLSYLSSRLLCKRDCIELFG